MTSPTLHQFLQAKLSESDYQTFLQLLKDYDDTNYTVGLSVDSVQSINPFFTTDEAIGILDDIYSDNDYIWGDAYQALDELVKELHPPQLMVDTIHQLLCNIYHPLLVEHFLEGYKRNFTTYLAEAWKQDYLTLPDLLLFQKSSSITDRLLNQVHSSLPMFLQENKIDSLPPVLDYFMAHPLPDPTHHSQLINSIIQLMHSLGYTTHEILQSLK